MPTRTTLHQSTPSEPGRPERAHFSLGYANRALSIVNSSFHGSLQISFICAVFHDMPAMLEACGTDVCRGLDLPSVL